MTDPVVFTKRALRRVHKLPGSSPGPVAQVGVHLCADGQWEARCECEWKSGPRINRGAAAKARTHHLKDHAGR